MSRTDRIIEIATRLLAAQFGTENEVTVTHAVDTAFKLDKLVHEKTRYLTQ